MQNIFTYSYLSLSLMFALAYIIVLVYFFLGIKKLKISHINPSKNKKKQVFTSLLIPLKNEEENLLELFDSLEQQTISPSDFELIFIDDSSVDKSLEMLNVFKEKHANLSIRIISQEQGRNGKKAAIVKGLSSAKGDYILCTDADCRHHPDWMKEMKSSAELSSAKMIIAPVGIANPATLLAKIQDLDFSSLMSGTLGMAAFHRAIMCNGANLMYEKDAFLKVNAYEDNKNIPSGDDMFLLHSIKKHFGKNAVEIASVHSVFVETKAVKNLKTFYKQHMRWTSKNGKYTDFDTNLLGIIIFMFNVLLFFSPLLLFSSIPFFLVLLSLFCLKIMMDYIVIQNYRKLYKLKKYGFLFLVFSIFYPFYVVSVSLLSFVLPVRWR